MLGVLVNCTEYLVFERLTAVNELPGFKRAIVLSGIIAPDFENK
jgi:hypothetical protein